MATSARRRRMAPGARERSITAIAPGPSPGQVENLTGARGSVSKRGSPPVVFSTSAPRDCPPRNVCTVCAGIGAAGRACGLLRRGRAARPFAPVSHPVAAESTSRTTRLAAGGRMAFERARIARAHRSALFCAGWLLLGRVSSRARVRAACARRSTRRPRANRTICLRARDFSVQASRRQLQTQRRVPRLRTGLLGRGPSLCLCVVRGGPAVLLCFGTSGTVNEYLL